MTVLCVLSFAPLACLRMCQFSHAITPATADATMLCSTNTNAAPSQDSLISDIQRVLAALTDCVPAQANIVTPLAALGLTLLVMLSIHRGAPKKITPPPRSLAH